MEVSKILLTDTLDSLFSAYLGRLTSLWTQYSSKHEIYDIFYVSLLKLFKHKYGAVTVPPPALLTSGGVEFEVESTCVHKSENRKLHSFPYSMERGWHRCLAWRIWTLKLQKSTHSLLLYPWCQTISFQETDSQDLQEARRKRRKLQLFCLLSSFSYLSSIALQSSCLSLELFGLTVSICDSKTPFLQVWYTWFDLQCQPWYKFLLSVKSLSFIRREMFQRNSVELHHWSEVWSRSMKTL